MWYGILTGSYNNYWEIVCSTVMLGGSTPEQLQWNLSIMVTLGTGLSGCYREVTL